METKQYLNFALKIAKKAGVVALRNYGKNLDIKFKGGEKHNLVTKVDHEIEGLLVSEIRKFYPGHCVLSEEGGNCGLKDSDHRWIIDPIDGTTNYAHGYSFFAISIGLEVKGKLVAGVVHAPYIKETYSAAKGKGAFLNGKRIKVSKVKSLATSLLATGFTYRNRGVNLPNFEYFLYNTQGIRRCGAATLDLCHVAAGRLDGYWEMGLKPWDIAAGALIVEEAGGKVSAFDGTKMTLDGKNLIATNGHLHTAICGFFKNQPQLKRMIEEA